MGELIHAAFRWLGGNGPVAGSTRFLLVLLGVVTTALGSLVLYEVNSLVATVNQTAKEGAAMSADFQVLKSEIKVKGEERDRRLADLETKDRLQDEAMGRIDVREQVLDAEQKRAAAPPRLPSTPPEFCIHHPKEC